MKNDFAIITKNAEETQSFGESFAKKLKAGDIVSLYGDLGSGKTQLVKGICRSLGVKQTVNSPTFVIVNEYSSPEFSLIYHFDLYRINSQAEVLDMGFNEYINNESIVFIEWPEHIEDILPLNTYKIHIAHSDEDEHSRWIRLETPEK
jgi:tRNA threonylcarbamoyladenosine biosynthesis protein TsaE